MSIETIIDSYVDKYSEAEAVALLYALAPPECGGLGYSIKLTDYIIDTDGWEVDEESRTISLDPKWIFSTPSDTSLAECLKDALEIGVLKTRASLISRIGWGMGKIVLGVVEAGIGVIGIVTPEPGTTAGGVVVLALGVNTMIDGASQLAGANQGHGFNPLSEGAGALGEEIAYITGIEPETGREGAQVLFLVSSIALGSWGSIRALRVPGSPFVRFGVGGQVGGLSIGRLDLMYGSLRARDGITILSINTNAGKSILRFVTHSGRLFVNGRIYGSQRVLQHATSGREILRGILKLLAHGSKY